MHLKNQPPVFVPKIYQRDLEKHSKAALMDMVWDLAQRVAGAGDDRPRNIFEEVERTAEIITTYRKQAKPTRAEGRT